MRVLVTGATGFVGVNFLAAVGAAHDVAALVRPGAPTDRLPEDVDVVAGDILDPESLPAALEGADAVVHLAASVYPNPEMRTINVEGSRHLFEAADAAGVDRVVFASTIGAHPEVPTDTDSVYQTSKVEAEALLADGDYGFAHSVVYPTYILGPRDYRLTRYDLFQRVAGNRVLVPPLYTYDDYNIVHVDDVTGTLRYAIESDTGDARHLVSGPNVGTIEVLRTVADALGGSCRVVNVPYPLAKYGVVPVINFLHRRGVSPVRGDGFVVRGDFGTLRADLTEQAPVTQRGWAAALEDTADWYRSVGLL